MGERLLWNRALMSELDSDVLLLGSGPCLWSPTVALHINQGRSGTYQAAKVLVREFWIKSPQDITWGNAFFSGSQVRMWKEVRTRTTMLEGLVDGMEDLFGGRGCVGLCGRLHRSNRFRK
ncbi:hypothetical protein M9H77_00404 [Catharanthus roseus]|nr:hypothetical protein M9H77_00404 [Catharanthus roseus]